MAVTKAPKIRHYRSSENSNVQKAHSSCQFNEGHKYLNQTKKNYLDYKGQNSLQRMSKQNQENKRERKKGRMYLV